MHKLTLSDILADLLRSTEPKSIRLQKGLALAYTPPAQSGQLHRLVLSRTKESPPSQQEANIILRHLTTQLGRQPLLVPPAPASEIINEHPCTVITWQIGQQRRLPIDAPKRAKYN